MIKKKLTIVNQLGLHARASMKLHDLANRFESSITIETPKACIDAKDILDIMSLAAAKGSSILLTCEGKDEKHAASDISNLIERKFDEE